MTTIESALRTPRTNPVRTRADWEAQRQEIGRASCRERVCYAV